MIHADKLRAVALFEFVSTVTRKGYLISTFGMPIFVLLYGGLISAIGMFADKQENAVAVFGVIDRAEVLALSGDVERSPVEIPEEIRRTLESSGRAAMIGEAMAFIGPRVFRPYEDEGAAQAALLEGTIKGYFVIEADYLETGRVDEYFRESVSLSEGDARRALRSLLLEKLLEGRVDEAVAHRVNDPISDARSWTVSDDGEVERRTPFAIVAKLVVPILFTMLLFVSLMMTASYLVQGTAVEKENKVAEVLLSAAYPEEILAGKLLGLTCAGLIQVVVWFGMVIAAAGLFAATLSAYGVDLPWGAAAVALPFFLAAYLFLGALMLGFGSLGGSLKESQQLTMVWTLLTVVPLMFLGMLLPAPHAPPALVMTWIPFTAPVTVILRLTLDASGVAWWEIVGSLVVMLISTWFALRLGARLFRVGLLLSGARPKLRELWRQARL